MSSLSNEVIVNRFPHVYLFDKQITSEGATIPIAEALLAYVGDLIWLALLAVARCVVLAWPLSRVLQKKVLMKVWPGPCVRGRVYNIVFAFCFKEERVLTRHGRL